MAKLLKSSTIEEKLDEVEQFLVKCMRRPTPTPAIRTISPFVLTSSLVDSETICPIDGELVSVSVSADVNPAKGVSSSAELKFITGQMSFSVIVPLVQGFGRLEVSPRPKIVADTTIQLRIISDKPYTKAACSIVILPDLKHVRSDAS